MVEDLYINNKAAFATWGVGLDETSYDNLSLPAPPKEPIENKSTNTNGKTVIISPFVDEMDIVVIFSIEASSKDDYLTKKNAFVTELNLGIALKVLSLKTVYNLYVKNYTELSQGYGIRNGHLSVKFCEPNPANRTSL